MVQPAADPAAQLAPRFVVTVETTPQRRESFERCLAALDASDARGCYHVLHKNCGRRVDDPGAVDHVPQIGVHRAEAMRWAHATGADFLIWLEDDARVGQHLLHNLRQWSAPTEPDFGAGWLFVPLGAWMDRNRIAQTRRGSCYRIAIDDEPAPLMHCCCAVLLPRRDLPALADAVERLDPGGQMFDLALAQAVHDLGRRLYLHWPPLAEHDLTVPSTWGHQHEGGTHDSGGYFRPALRLDGCVDPDLYTPVDFVAPPSRSSASNPGTSSDRAPAGYRGS